MKIKNFKKAIHRVGCYKHHVPMILSKITMYDDLENIYYKCGKVKAVTSLYGSKFIINKEENEY
jgi:hypothetical protein